MPKRVRTGFTWRELLAVVAIIGLLVALLTPQVQQAGHGSARREACKDNLKQIGLALHLYHDAYGSFPPAYVVDELGKPLYSWRVLVLPYLDQGPLYEKFHLDERWDSPHNAPLLEPVPDVFRCPSHGVTSKNNSPSCTHYVGVFGPRCLFRGSEAVTRGEIIDDASQTLQVAEVTDVVIPWSAPQDIDIAQHPTFGDRQGFSSDHKAGLHGLFADGRVRFLTNETDADTDRRLIIRDSPSDNSG